MVFKESDQDRADLQLFLNGGIALYWRQEVFESAIASLEALDYRILIVGYETSSQFRKDMSAVLKWEDQFGYTPWTGNLDALNDGLRQEPFDSGNDNAICIENFQFAVRDDSDWARCLLDVLARTARNYLLFGKRLLILIQTTDATFHCENLGGVEAWWNPKEWLDSNRGL